MRIGRKRMVLCVSFIILNLFSLQHAYSKELEAVKVYYKPTIGQAPIMIAVEEGFFEEQGIKVEFVKVNTSSEIWLLFLNGAIDVKLAAPASALYTAAALNKNIKLVAGSNYLKRGNKSEGLAVRTGANNKADTETIVKGLKGKKLGILQVGSLASYLVDITLKKYGLSDKDVELVNMPLSSMSQALQSGILDAGILSEPFVSILRMKYGDLITMVPFGDASPDTPYIFMVYGERLLVKDPQLGVRFMTAWLKGLRQYDEGKTARNMEIIEKYTELDEETLKNVDWVILNPDGIYESSKILDNYQDWLLGKNLIDKKVPAGSLVDTSFLERARSNLE